MKYLHVKVGSEEYSNSSSLFPTTGMEAVEQQEEPWELLKQYLKTFYPRSRVSTYKKFRTQVLYGVQKLVIGMSVWQIPVCPTHTARDPWTPASPRHLRCQVWADGTDGSFNESQWNRALALKPTSPVRGLYLSDTVSFLILYLSKWWSMNI